MPLAPFLNFRSSHLECVSSKVDLLQSWVEGLLSAPRRTRSNPPTTTTHTSHYTQARPLVTRVASGPPFSLAPSTTDRPRRSSSRWYAPHQDASTCGPSCNSPSSSPPRPSCSRLPACPASAVMPACSIRAMPVSEEVSFFGGREKTTEEGKVVGPRVMQKCRQGALDTDWFHTHGHVYICMLQLCLCWLKDVPVPPFLLPSLPPSLLPSILPSIGIEGQEERLTTPT
jgi:hypothetical protein